jgi:restriction system protein
MLARGVAAEKVNPTIDAQDAALDWFAGHKSLDLSAGLTFNPKMSPLEFEQFCAAILSRGGWNTTLTPGSGDQGADIVARRNGECLIVQCKLYSGPVGNKAVQEAHTAMVHVGGTRAAVVSNAEFTPQAQQLANTTGTELLHFTQLADL